MTTKTGWIHSGTHAETMATITAVFQAIHEREIDTDLPRICEKAHILNPEISCFCGLNEVVNLEIERGTYRMPNSHLAEIIQIIVDWKG